MHGPSPMVTGGDVINNYFYYWNVLTNINFYLLIMYLLVTCLYIFLCVLAQISLGLISDLFNECHALTL